MVSSSLLLSGCDKISAQEYSKAENISHDFSTTGSESIVEGTINLDSNEKYLVTEKNIKIYDNSREFASDETIETIFIANQEIPIFAENVTLMISDIENTTDISGIENLYNLKSLNIFRYTDGNTPYISGFDQLKDCETLESLCFNVGLENPNDIYVLNTLPNLKSLTIYGIEAYEDWDFDLQNIENLRIVGTFDISRITHITGLQSLNLEYNYSKELSSLTNFSELQCLEITECGFNDYTPLLNCDKLKELFISSIPMTEEMYKKIIETFPKCEITIVNITK